MKSSEEVAALLVGLAPLAQQKLIRPMHQELELAPTPFHALVLLSEHDHLSMSDLAARLRVPKQNITVVADKLIQLGYVHRRRDEADRRLTLLAITEAGRAFLAEHRRRMARMMAQRLRALSEPDIAALREGLETIHRVLAKL